MGGSHFTEVRPRKPIYLNYPRCHPRGRSDVQGPIHHSPRLAPANGKIFKLTPHILEINSTPFGDYPRAPGETVKKCTIFGNKHGTLWRSPPRPRRNRKETHYVWNAKYVHIGPYRVSPGARGGDPHKGPAEFISKICGVNLKILPVIVCLLLCMFVGGN